jgi:hypothetical protein
MREAVRKARKIFKNLLWGKFPSWGKFPNSPPPRFSFTLHTFRLYTRRALPFALFPVSFSILVSLPPMLQTVETFNFLQNLPPRTFKKFPLYFVGSLTGNPVFFGFWPTETEAARIGAARVKNEDFSAFFVGPACIVSE